MPPRVAPINHTEYIRLFILQMATYKPAATAIQQCWFIWDVAKWPIDLCHICFLNLLRSVPYLSLICEEIYIDCLNFSLKILFGVPWFFHALCP